MGTRGLSYSVLQASELPLIESLLLRESLSKGILEQTECL